MPDTTENLVEFRTWFDQRIHWPDGRPYSTRSRQMIARRYKLPVIEVGHARLIDPQAGDERLREHALFQGEPQPRRGRPRTGGVP